MKSMIIGMCLLSFSSIPAMETVTAATPAAAASLSDQTAVRKDNIWEVFQSRRSVRKFKSEAVPEDDILKIIGAARTAPTSGNQQPWKFLVVRDTDKINRMKDACLKRSLDRLTADQRRQNEDRIKSRLNDYFSAPVYIVILTDNNSLYPGYNHWDGPLAAGYLMLAARALGYGTVFITDAVPDEVTKDVLQIPDRYARVCLTPLGVPVEWPASPEKKKLEEFIAFEALK